MRAVGFTCYRKDATGAFLEAAQAATDFKGDFIVTDGPGSTQQAAKVAALAQAFPGTVEFVESRNEVDNRAAVFGGRTDWANAHAYHGNTDSWPDYGPGQVANEMAAAMPASRRR